MDPTVNEPANKQNTAQSLAPSSKQIKKTHTPESGSVLKDPSVNESAKEGNKNTIMAPILKECLRDKDAAFDKYFNADRCWDTLIAEEADISSKEQASTGERAWVFEDELFKKVCGNNRPRF